MPTFSENYAQPLTRSWEQLFDYLGWNSEEAKTIVEIGSYEGSSTLWFLDHLLLAPDSKIYCIDVWTIPERLQRFQENIAENAGKDKVTAIRAHSFGGLVKLLTGGVQADMVYVDGSHAAVDVLADLVLSFRLVKRGGLILCDDYLWADPRFGGGTLVGRPKLAIDAFTSIFSEKIQIVSGHFNYQVPIRKIAD